MLEAKEITVFFAIRKTLHFFQKSLILGFFKDVIGRLVPASKQPAYLTERK